MSLSSRKRRKRFSLDSSSDDDLGYSTPCKKGETSMEKNTRSSDRISARKNKSFRMPSREDVWDNILPTKSPDKYYHLKPKKLINNFTKENNSYNYDPIVTSGSESMDDFIDDDIQYIKERKKKNPVHRIKNRRTRVIQETSDSSSSTDSDYDGNTRAMREGRQDEDVSDEGTGSNSEVKQEADEDVEEGDSDNSTVNRDHETTETTENGEALIRECDNQSSLSKDIKKENCNSQEIGLANEQILIKMVSLDTKEERVESDSQIHKVISGSDDNDSNFGENFVKSKHKRRKSKVLDSDSEDECVTKRNDDLESNTIVEQNQTENQLEDQLEYEVEDEDVVNIDDDSDDNDSFIVDDDDCESDIDVNTDTDCEDIPDIIDNESDPGEGTSTGRKKHVRVMMMQKQKERNELFSKFRNARMRKQARLKLKSNKT